VSSLAVLADTNLLDLSWSRTLSGTVTDLAWSADAASLLAGCGDGSLQRISNDGAALTSWQGHAAGVTRLQPRPGSDRCLASAGEDGRVVLWDSAGGVAQAVLAEQGGRVEQLAWSRDGRLLAAAASKSISLWHGEQSLGIWYDSCRRILNMAWALDGERLAAATDKGLYLWRCDGSDLIKLHSLPGAATMVAWQPHGQTLAAGTQDGFLQVWHLQADDNGQAEPLTLRSHPGSVARLAWHPARPLLATAAGPELMLWDLPPAGSAAGRSLRQHRRPITAMAWSPDGRCLASADQAGRLCLWDSRGALLSNQQLDDAITTLAWRPSGLSLAIGDSSGGCSCYAINQPTQLNPDIA